jgi:PPOX class probable F420-dependent enzyme
MPAGAKACHGHVTRAERMAEMTIAQHETTERLPCAVGIDGKYLSLTTYRRDGTPVSTPVWFVEEDGRLLVTTAADSYKAKRLRANPAAMVAPCTATGTPKGEPIPARVQFMPAAEHDHVDRLMAKKYRVDRVLVLPLYRLVTRLRGKSTSDADAAYLAITPT